MASRNQTASWIHYPLAQSADTPLTQGDKQQVTWFFRLGMIEARPSWRFWTAAGVGLALVVESTTGVTLTLGAPGTLTRALEAVPAARLAAHGG